MVLGCSKNKHLQEKRDFFVFFRPSITLSEGTRFNCQKSSKIHLLVAQNVFWSKPKTEFEYLVSFATKTKVKLSTDGFFSRKKMKSDCLKYCYFQRCFWSSFLTQSGLFFLKVLCVKTSSSKIQGLFTYLKW